MPTTEEDRTRGQRRRRREVEDDEEEEEEDDDDAEAEVEKETASVSQWPKPQRKYCGLSQYKLSYRTALPDLCAVAVSKLLHVI